MTASPWPPALVGTPAVAVIERAIGRGRLGHSLLLQGEDLETLAAVALGIADRLLNGPGGVYFPPEKHPDCFALRPAKKMRLIGADPTRELIGDLQKSPAVGSQKVAIIYEADRMNREAANIFLKTLEEPPAHTTLLLLTTRPHSLLPTIRSRCLHFRFPSRLPATWENSPAPAAPSGAEDGEIAPSPGAMWQSWLADYGAWLARVSAGAPDKQALADHLFSIYGLLTRFKLILDAATAAVWEKERALLPPTLEDEEAVAVEIGITNGLRLRFFGEIEAATLAFAHPRLEAGSEPIRRAFTAAIGTLERDVRLLTLNLNESAVLEDFLLASLRLWAKQA